MIDKKKAECWFFAYELTPYSTNSGNCENFAQFFQKDIPGSEIVGTDDYEGWDTPLPGHIWLTDGKLHYDSECLEGTKYWKDLPIFKRYYDGKR